jgi:hypothetical protein
MNINIVSNIKIKNQVKFYEFVYMYDTIYLDCIIRNKLKKFLKFILSNKLFLYTIKIIMSHI